MLFYFFVLTLGNFGGLRFRVFGVLGSYGLRVFVLEVFVFDTPVDLLLVIAGVGNMQWQELGTIFRITQAVRATEN